MKKRRRKKSRLGKQYSQINFVSTSQPPPPPSAQAMGPPLYRLCLARSKVPAVDLIAIYRTLVRSILEYGSPVWAALPEYLIDHC